MTPEEEFIRLSWWILEQKAIYYLGHGDMTPIHRSWVDNYGVEDAEYDKKERRYISLAYKLGKDPTASDMVGFDPSRHSCELVLKKLSRPMPKNMMFG